MNNLFLGEQPYSIMSDVAQIQTEIMTNGPVEAAFTVYADFPSYKSGVYIKHSDQELGGHAIKIIGWGVQKGVVRSRFHWPLTFFYTNLW